jgi:hypothetical protein
MKIHRLDGAPDGVIIELLEHRQWAAFLGPGA